MVDGRHFDGPPNSFWVRYLMNRWLNRIQLLSGGSIGIFDYLINFWEALIQNKMADGGHLKKMVSKGLWVRYLMNPWFGLIQIWCGGFLAISNDLNNFLRRIN